MEKDVVCSEAEFSMITNNITEYIDFLLRSIEEYIRIVSDIQENAIQDSTTCAALEEIEKSLKETKSPLCLEKGLLAEKVRIYFKEMERVDVFKFPNEFGVTVSALLARML